MKSNLEIDEMATQALERSVEVLDKKWIQKHWYTQVVYDEKYDSSYTHFIDERLNRSDYIFQNEEFDGACLVGGVDHSVWFIANANKLNLIDYCSLQRTVYNRIWDTLVEQYPEFFSPISTFYNTFYSSIHEERIGTMVNWNDYDGRQKDDVITVLDKASKK